MMTRTLTGLKIKAYHPDATTPHTTVSDAIGSVTIDERITDAKDDGELNIDATDAAVGDITAGDRIEVYTQLDGEPSLTRRWTGLARSPTDTLSGNGVVRRQINVVDFVFGILSMRQAFANFEGRQIAGTETAILNTLLRNECPEIGRGQISTVTQTTDAFVNGRSLYGVIAEDLAAIADSVVTQDGTDIIFAPLGDVTATVGITPDDLYAPIEVERNDDNLVNQVRVAGATDHAVDDAQPTQSNLQTVTATTRLTTQIQTRKSEVGRVEIYTSPNANGEELRVRLQATRGGAAVEPSDTSSDIARQSLDPNFLATDGFTTFLLPTHTLAPNENPTLIVETTGSSGHDVGVDSNGNLTYRASYPFPLLTEAVDQQSIGTYRRRDRRLQDDSLGSFAAVRDKSESVLDRRANPETTVQADARSKKAHTLSTGTVVTMDGFDSVGVSGDYIVKERMTEIAGTQLRTGLLFQAAATV